ncbi:MAG: FAD-dependent oxidoreductase [Novosphingobium sp.]|nr:FAD-dependent oxidoreductase [Novosphingobium sp.]
MAVAEQYDIAIIGAGMAGASLAAAIGGDARTVLLEAEGQPGYHATGRSAAFWTESYGGPAIQPLTSASGQYLRDGGFLKPRAALTIARTGQEARIKAFAERYARLGVTVRILDRAELSSLVPGLADGWSCGALEPSCCDIDVAALHQHFLAKARQAGVELRGRARVDGARREADVWRVGIADGEEIRCGVLVNAAGAWADEIAGLAGVAPIGIAPLRRTVVQLQVAPETPASLPLVLDLAEEFYFKPVSGRLWLSPHDETPSSACDAAPEELDVATAIARLEEVVDWKVLKLEHSWAGLRSFAPDRMPVYGFDPGVAGFFWCAGQGGFGIQTAPAAAQLAASLLLDRQTGEIDPAPYAPDRFR